MALTYTVKRVKIPLFKENGQKKRPLIKPFVIVAENGVIIGIYGPFSATINDAKILELILKDDFELRNLIRKKDVMVLDRGFRDVIKHLEKEYELITLMPCCSLDKQLTTYQANCTRMVTKIRERMVFLKYITL